MDSPFVFPRSIAFDPGSSGFYSPEQDGMTLRDYFAAAALQGLISEGDAPAKWTPAIFAMNAYEFADAMLIARGVSREPGTV